TGSGSGSSPTRRVPPAFEHLAPSSAVGARARCALQPMSFARITVEQRGHVLLVGLKRVDKRNAFDLQMYAELGQALGDLHRNADLRCGLLFAHGNHFTGGIELPQWL